MDVAHHTHRTQMSEVRGELDFASGKAVSGMDDETSARIEKEHVVREEMWKAERVRTSTHLLEVV